mmetsp:Transcript_20449/g.52472  ORF Transcript_20449/g.52472 Transcript_20449/m.52472 type:complete len:579 (-) Transcript_20449:384-2120(-)|eukprot:CAMPEP_0113875552 /NCGR_PEP_ID=MMETSP0780_2-20120614/5008_1 /TAXON_ID=652834 /ORGANISM="Palpitomonas bilix" /LENGTH=578 /DNA_ID=CAMNT_0000861559 /DNA_START=163 /DNA_END=1899 /DNA_ORIENTATION=+ /assembly_acc=CAM_ASM_000599
MEGDRGKETEMSNMAPNPNPVSTEGAYPAVFAYPTNAVPSPYYPPAQQGYYSSGSQPPSYDPSAPPPSTGYSSALPGAYSAYAGGISNSNIYVTNSGGYPTQPYNVDGQAAPSATTPSVIAIGEMGGKGGGTNTNAAMHVVGASVSVQSRPIAANTGVKTSTATNARAGPTAQQPIKTASAKSNSEAKCCKYFCIVLSIVIVLAGAGVGAYFGITAVTGQDPNYYEPLEVSFPLQDLREVHSGSQDDWYMCLAMSAPFYIGTYTSIDYSGDDFSTACVGSNSYITFGSGSERYSSLSASNPAGPKIMIGAADNSIQRLYYTKRFDGIGIRFEGSASTSGTVGYPNIVWEVAIMVNGDVHIYIEQCVRTNGLSGISDGTYFPYTFSYEGGTRVNYTREELMSTYYPTHPDPNSPVARDFPLSNLVTVDTGSYDDYYWTFSLPFSFSIEDRSYSRVYLCSNSYLTFSSGQTAYSGLSASNPVGRKIFVQGADNSAQRVSTVSTSTYFGIRYEGTSSTSGNLANVNIIWEMIFYQDGGLGIYVERMGRTGGVTGISNGYRFTNTFSTTDGAISYFTSSQLN